MSGVVVDQIAASDAAVQAKAAGAAVPLPPVSKAALHEELISELAALSKQYGFAWKGLPKNTPDLQEFKRRLPDLAAGLASAEAALKASGRPDALQRFNLDFTKGALPTFGATDFYENFLIDIEKGADGISKHIVDGVHLHEQTAELGKKLTDASNPLGRGTVYMSLDDDHQYSINDYPKIEAAISNIQNGLKAVTGDLSTDFSMIALTLKPPSFSAVQHAPQVLGSQDSPRLSVCIDEDPAVIAAQLDSLVSQVKAFEAAVTIVDRRLSELTDASGFSSVVVENPDVDPIALQRKLADLDALAKEAETLMCPEIDYKLLIGKGSGPASAQCMFDEDAGRWTVSVKCHVADIDKTAAGTIVEAAQKALFADELAPQQFDREALGEFIRTAGFNNAYETKKLVDLGGPVSRLVGTDPNAMLVVGSNLADNGASVTSGALKDAIATVNQAKDLYDKVHLFKDRNVIVISNNELAGELKDDPAERDKMAALAEKNGDKYRFGRKPLIAALEKEAASVVSFRPLRDGSDLKQVHDAILNAIKTVKPPMTIVVDTHGTKEGMILVSSKLPQPSDSGLAVITNEEIADALAVRRLYYPELDGAAPEDKDIVLNGACYGNNQARKTNEQLLLANIGKDILPIQISAAEEGLLGYSDYGQATGDRFFNLMFAHLPSELTIGDLSRIKSDALHGSTNFAIRVPMGKGDLKIAALDRLVMPS